MHIGEICSLTIMLTLFILGMLRALHLPNLNSQSVERGLRSIELGTMQIL